MSDVPADYAERLNLREQLSRIDRQREEAQKLSAEREKLMTEQLKLGVEMNKLSAEALKLSAEEAKLRRDRSLAPIVVAATLSGVLAGALATAAAQLLPLLRSSGLH